MQFPTHKQFRLPGYDYSSVGYYFITIVTKERIHYFGEITNSIIQKTAIANFVENTVKNIPIHFKNIIVNEFCIMPNHVHLLLKITHHVGTHDRLPNVGTHDHAFLQKPNHYQNMGLKSGSIISQAIKQFKRAITIYCNQNLLPFAWQPRFYDRIIRSEPELLAIRKYILDNPKNWAKDSENKTIHP